MTFSFRNKTTAEESEETVHDLGMFISRWKLQRIKNFLWEKYPEKDYVLMDYNYENNPKRSATFAMLLGYDKSYFERHPELKIEKEKQVKWRYNANLNVPAIIFGIVGVIMIILGAYWMTLSPPPPGYYYVNPTIQYMANNSILGVFVLLFGFLVIAVGILIGKSENK